MSDSPSPIFLKRNHVTDPLEDMDWLGLQAYLDLILSPEFDIDKICAWIIRAENIVCKHASLKREAARNQLLTDLETYTKDRVGLQDAKKIRALHDLILMLEKGYRDIWAARLTDGVETLTAEERVSGTFWTAHSVLCRIDKITTAYLEQAHAISNAMAITDEKGNPVNPDAETSAICHVATMTCLGEGFANRWFNKHGVLVLPDLSKLTSAKQALSEKASMNALFWRNWQTIDEHRRFLGGEINHFQEPDLPDWVNGPYSAAAEYRLPHDHIERFDMIANDRWKRQLIQNFMEMRGRTNLSKLATGLTRPLAIGPGLLVSEEEGLTLIALCETFFHNVNSDQRRYHGLRLAEWTRGYAVLQQLIVDRFDPKGPASLFPQMPRQAWSDLLQKYGQTATTAKAFIDHALFKRTSRDLYDCPLVALSNGDITLFGAALKGGSLSEIVLSALGRLETVFDDKGPDYEAYMLEFLNKQDGVVAKTKSVKKNGEQYQFDILMLFDGAVFHFELKNRSMSSGVPQRIYYDFKRVEDDIKQTQRLAGALDDYPEILNGLFGLGTSDLPRIDSLLYARPYAYPGGIEEIAVFDAQSLRRFFKKRYLNLTAQHNLNGHKIEMPVPVKDFWEQDSPTSEALIAQIIEPYQVGLAWAHLGIGHVFSEIGRKKVCAREENQHSPMTHESIAAHFEVDIDAIVKNHTELEAKIRNVRTKLNDK